MKVGIEMNFHLSCIGGLKALKSLLHCAKDLRISLHKLFYYKHSKVLMKFSLHHKK